MVWHNIRRRPYLKTFQENNFPPKSLFSASCASIAIKLKVIIMPLPNISNQVWKLRNNFPLLQALETTALCYKSFRNDHKLSLNRQQHFVVTLLITAPLESFASHPARDKTLVHSFCSRAFKKNGIFFHISIPLFPRPTMISHHRIWGWWILLVHFPQWAFNWIAIYSRQHLEGSWERLTACSANAVSVRTIAKRFIIANGERRNRENLMKAKLA